MSHPRNALAGTDMTRPWCGFSGHIMSPLITLALVEDDINILIATMVLGRLVDAHLKKTNLTSSASAHCSIYTATMSTVCGLSVANSNLNAQSLIAMAAAKYGKPVALKTALVGMEISKSSMMQAHKLTRNILCASMLGNHIAAVTTQEVQQAKTSNSNKTSNTSLTATPLVPASNQLQQVTFQVDNNTNFTAACEAGQLDVVSNMLTVDRLTHANHIDLRSACKNGHTAVVDLILTNMNSNSLIEGFPHACIADACANGHTDTVRLLLKDRRVQPNLQANKALCQAAVSGHAGVVELLLSDCRVDPHALEPLLTQLCGQEGQADVVKVLIEDGRTNFATNQSIALHEATKFDKVDIANLLLDSNKVDPSSKDNFCIIAASGRGQTSLVKRLISYPNVDATARNCAAMATAAQHGYAETLQVLLTATEAPIDISETFEQVLHQGFVDVVSLLLPRIVLSAEEVTGMICEGFERKTTMRTLGPLLDLALARHDVDGFISKAMVWRWFNSACANGNIAAVKQLSACTAMKRNKTKFKAALLAAVDGDHANIVLEMWNDERCKCLLDELWKAVAIPCSQGRTKVLAAMFADKTLLPTCRIFSRLDPLLKSSRTFGVEVATVLIAEKSLRQVCTDLLAVKYAMLNNQPKVLELYLQLKGMFLGVQATDIWVTVPELKAQLQRACADGYVEIVHLLLNDTRFCSLAKVHELNLIRIASSKGHRKLVELLLSCKHTHGLDWNTSDFDRAGVCFQVEIMKLFCKREHGGWTKLVAMPPKPSRCTDKFLKDQTKEEARMLLLCARRRFGVHRTARVGDVLRTMADELLPLTTK
jgi:ankyrin repeat protein